MYCIFENGGKQHKVHIGQKVRLEKLVDAPGTEISLDKVVMLSDGKRLEYGAPYLKGKAVQARVLQHGRGDKISVIKFKRRKHHLKRMNHRQSYTEIEILGLGQAKKTTQAATQLKAEKTAKPARQATAKKRAKPATQATTKATGAAGTRKITQETTQD